MKEANKNYLEQHVFPKLTRVTEALEMIATSLNKKVNPPDLEKEDTVADNKNKSKRNRKKKSIGDTQDVLNDLPLKESGITG